MNSGEMTNRGRIMMLVLLAVISLSGVFDHSLWSGNDTREGAMIREMARTRSWVLPVFNGNHYFEKPPLLHWTGVVFCRVSGTVNEGLVRLPAALYSFFTLLIVVIWGRALGREQAGFAAAFMCATSVLFFEYARIVLTDSCLTFMVVFSLWLFWRTQTAEKWLVRRYLLFLFMAAFSFYAKGLVGPGMIWLAVIAWLFIQKRYRLMLVLVPAFALVFIFVMAPWVFALWKTGGAVFLQKVFWENQFGRFLYFNDPTLPVDPYLIHKEPVYFYLFSLPVRLMPWTLLVVPALYYWFRRESPVKGGLAVFLKTSLLAIAFLLHISAAKAACYALPLFPFIFLMTAVWMEDAAAAWETRVDRRLIGITFIATGFAVLCAPAVYLIAFLLRLPLVWYPCPLTAWACFFIALMAIAAGYILGRKTWAAFSNGRRRAALLAMPVIVSVIGIVGVSVFVPAVDFSRSYRPFAGLVMDEISAGRRMVFPSDSERDLGAFMFYLDSRLETFSLTDGASLESLPRYGKEPLGIVVPVKKLIPVIGWLKGLPVAVKKVDNCGRKSGSFRLVTIDPEGKRPARYKTNPGKPKRTGN
jgi:4-amino-4-deoxy-L-arabinose transferase-like glycosyltransferase